MNSKSTIQPRLLAIGGAHIDRRGQVSGDYAPAASNPGSMRQEVGGVVFNALRTAVRRGLTGDIISLRGGDAAGDDIARAIGEAGITDRSAVFLDRASASYTAVIDRHGDLIVGLADTGIYDLFPRQLRRSACRDAIETADAVLCDANLPKEALERIAELAGRTQLHAIGISPAKVVRLSDMLAHISCLFMNRKEAAALTGLRADAPHASLVILLRAAGLKRAVVTDAASDVLAYDADDIWLVRPPVPKRVADVTGAGDAFAGAAVAAMLRGVPFQNAVREGVAAAKLTTEADNVVPNFDDEIFAAALAEVPPARLLEGDK
ncbi:MAG: carbohydrate kinase family protein [Mesorhizobium sp.]